MAYISLYDILEREGTDFSRGFNLHQPYRGTLEKVLSETEEVLVSREDTARLALHPPRIIRALIDYKIQHQNKSNIEYLLRMAIQLSLDIYKGNGNTINGIKELRRKIKSTGNRDVLKKELAQGLDDVTWKATDPDRSRRTVERLTKKIDGAMVLFIAFAHGGVATGIDVFLRYCDNPKSKDSVFYVARFSRYKWKDETPQLSKSEIAYLQELAKERQVVIFDEDKSSGRTMRLAEDFFTDLCFPDFITLVNNG